MTRNLRPPLGSSRASFGSISVVSPVGGAPFTAAAIRMPLTTTRPGIDTTAEVDNRPRFRFLKSEVADLPVGSTFTIAGGPDVGTFTVERVDRSDPEILQVVVQG